MIKKEQIKDEDLSKIINDLVKSSLQAEDYWYDQEILFKIDSSASREDTARVCIPKSLVKSVLEVFHDQCAHPGTGKTYLLTKSQVHWINMMSDIQRYVAKCLRCVQAKNSVNRRVMSGHLVLPPHAGHTYAIDILGSLPAVKGCNQNFNSTRRQGIVVIPRKNDGDNSIEDANNTVHDENLEDSSEYNVIDNNEENDTDDESRNNILSPTIRIYSKSSH